MNNGLLSYSPATNVRQGSRVHALDRRAAALLQKATARARVRIVLWDGTPASDLEAPIGDLLIRDRRTLFALIVNPDLYFGEAYATGLVDIRGDFGLVIDAMTAATPPRPPTSRERMTALVRWGHTLRDARRNIHHHYDLGNAFYAQWLDSDLVYTCAYYPRADASLEEAQRAKMDLVCRKVGLQPGEHVIEAGCGWGALALYMARHYGVTVTAYNISREQVRHAREQAAREGLASRVTFVEDDYRHITGRCDAFVSVGMLEHVGRCNLGEFAAVLRRVLEPASGRGLVHFIGRDRPRPLNAWIRRRIFPGAYPPSIAEVTTEVLEPAGVCVQDVENLRVHYARTLAHWRERFEAAAPRIRGDFSEGFYRAWRLYLAGSEAAFKAGWLQLFQIVFAPAGRAPVHWSRADLYRAGPHAAV